MKSAEEYYLEHLKWCEGNNGGIQRFKRMVVEAIKNAQLDAIDAACKRCAEDTTLLINNLSSTDKEYNDYYQCGDDEISVDRKSILKVAEKMKEELE